MALRDSEYANVKDNQRACPSVPLLGTLLSWLNPSYLSSLNIKAISSQIFADTILLFSMAASHFFLSLLFFFFPICNYIFSCLFTGLSSVSNNKLNTMWTKTPPYYQ